MLRINKLEPVRDSKKSELALSVKPEERRPPVDQKKTPDFRIATLTVNDLIDAVAAGLRDFRAAPLYGLTIASG
jgi:hypothetical protein